MPFQVDNSEETVSLDAWLLMLICLRHPWIQTTMFQGLLAVDPAHLDGAWYSTDCNL